MTPRQYEELVKHHRLLVEAKKLDKIKTDSVAHRIRLVAFKQEAGMYPDQYIKEYDNCWKD